MIRIDEIYNNTFWLTRLFYYGPAGRSDPDSLFNLGKDDAIETDYIFAHDQEPIHLDLHKSLFDSVIIRNKSKGHVNDTTVYIWM